MVQRIGGFRRKTRFKLQKGIREKGKLSISKFFQKFEAGDKVCLKAQPSVHSGMYYPRFHGKVGVVNKKRGFCYEITIKDGNKQKMLIVHPVHMKSV